MKIFPAYHYIIKTKLSKGKIYQRLSSRDTNLYFDLGIYFNHEKKLKYGKQYLLNSLKLDHIPPGVNDPIQVYNGSVNDNGIIREIRIEVFMGSRRKFFLIMWTTFWSFLLSFFGLAFLFEPSVVGEEAPLIFLGLCFMMIFGQIIIRHNFSRSVDYSKEYFSRLFEGI